MGPEEPRVERRLAAIFAADVAGYSRLMGQDEAGTLRALSAARATLGCLIAEHGGRIVNSVGDSVLAEFPSAVDAVKCAMAVQQRLAEEDAEAAEGPRLPFRIAVHVGDVLPRGEDIYGDGINVCARLQEVAEPRGICISDAAYQYVRKVLPVVFDDLGERTLKNIDEPVRVFAIRAAREPGHSPPRPKPSAAPDLTVAPRQAKMRKLGWIAVGGLAAAMALFLVYQFAPPDGTTPAQQTGVEAAKAASSTPAGAIAIAVLPFVNISGDPAQEFFSDGMTEEITSALAKIPDLRVVARGSAFQFKDEKRDTRAVGRALGATHLIEGSVRREGDRVRITAQLIEASRGVNVWTESYDRQLASVFATQEDIATAIARALRMPLGLKPGERLVSSRNIDQESYQQYLRAKALVRGRLGVDARAGLKALNDAIALLEQVVARNPDYAPAWALMGNAYLIVPNYSRNLFGGSTSIAEIRPVVQSALSKAEPAARRAVQLDPNLADGYGTLASMRDAAGKLLEEEELWSKALSLDPNDPEVLSGYARFLAVVGRVKEALTVSQQLQELEPFIPLYNRNMALVLWLNGQDDAAIEILRKIGGNSLALVAFIQAGASRYNEATDSLMMSPLARSNPTEVAEAVRLLRMAPAKIASPENVKRLGFLDFVYLYVGAPGQALVNYEINLEAGWTNFTNRLLSHPSYGPARKTERYKAFARKAGLVEYWRAKGWPEFCHPTTGDDFACE
jgi:adenylate cyclase